VTETSEKLVWHLTAYSKWLYSPGETCYLTNTHRKENIMFITED